MKIARPAKSMGASKAHQLLTAVLEREEWFFAKVPEDEIITCFYYEYARSRDDICLLVHSWREKLANLNNVYDAASVETATQKFWSELAQLTDATCSQLLINLPEFPKVPWQGIRPSRRTERKRLLTFYKYLDSIRGGLWRETNQNALHAIRYAHLQTSLGELVPFSIDWRGGVERVILAILRSGQENTIRSLS